jgi:DNA polymerase III sliding clamp (beta) subunit (PCNA family)
MQIRVEKLRRALELLHPVVPRKPTVEIIKNVHLANGYLVGTDLGNFMSVEVPESEGIDILLPYRSLLELLKYVPGDLTLNIEPGAEELKLSWEGGSSTLSIDNDPKDFPGVTDRAELGSANLDGDMLVSALMEAVPYCAMEENRPVLCGVSLYLGNVMQVGASDGFRLSFKSLSQSFPVTQIANIPAESVKLLDFLWKKNPGLPADNDAGTLIGLITARRELNLALFNDMVRFKFSGINLMIKTIEGKPPDHLGYLGGVKEDTKAIFMAPELKLAVQRIKGIAKETSSIVKLVWSDNLMKVSAVSGDIGEISIDVPLEVGSGSGRIALNYAQVLDYLAEKPGLVSMSISTESTPAVFHYGQYPVAALMPMKINWDEKPAKKKEEPPKDETKTPEGDANTPKSDTEQPNSDTSKSETCVSKEVEVVQPAKGKGRKIKSNK